MENEKVRKEDTVGSLMRRILLRSVVVLGILGAIGLVVGWFMEAYQGLFAGLLAFGVVAFFCLMTPAVFAGLSRSRVTFRLLAGCLVASWLIKIVIIAIVMMSLRSAGWFDHKMFAVFVVIGALAIVGVEVQTVMTSRLPYVSPRK